MFPDFQDLPEAVLAVEEGTLRITAVTNRAKTLLEFPNEQSGNETLHEILSPGDLAAVVSGKTELSGLHIRDFCGRCLDADLSVETRGDVILIGIHDAAPRVKLEEQLRQAQKMEALGMLAGGIAHDFNNLLTIISGYSQMLMTSAHMTAERDRTAIEQVLKASERAADLTSQLLAFSRRQSIQPRVLELNRVVDQAATMLRRLIGEDVDLRIEKAFDAGKIHADMGQMQQTLMNLAINARDAMPEGGTLSIRTKCADLGGEKPGRHAVLEVTDTGTGMDETTRKRIFEPFFTTKPQGKGTGLGLSTVYGIVRQSGGWIDLLTAPGEGTTFRVFLPAVETAVTEDIAVAKEARGGHETVLLVEDEEGVRRMVHAALERKGYRVLVASHGAEALKVSRAWDGPIDIMVTDVIMPQMNGRELAEQMMQERPLTVVLYVSGYPGDTLLNAGTLLTESAFLQKPFAPATLTTRVRELLDARQTNSMETGAGI